MEMHCSLWGNSHTRGPEWQTHRDLSVGRPQQFAHGHPQHGDECFLHCSIATHEPVVNNLETGNLQSSHYFERLVGRCSTVRVDVAAVSSMCGVGWGRAHSFFKNILIVGHALTAPEYR
jgi:hypothetical protein